MLANLRPLASGYGQHGASHAKKSLLGWMFAGGSPDEDIVEHVDTLRERSRDLYMGTPLATGAVKVLVKNTVGAGLQLSPQVDAKALGLSDDEADAWEQLVCREWQLWAGSQHCDAGRTCNFGQLQSLAFLSVLLSGDAFAVLPPIRRRGSIYDLRVQLLEADRVCDPSQLDPALDVLQGVELGTYGEPVAYYVAKNHPLSTRYVVDQLQTWKRIPAFGSQSGRRNILHLLLQERPEQRRGAPLLAPVIGSLKQLGRYSEAELAAAVIAGMLTVFVKSDKGESIPLGQSIPAEDQVDTAEGALELGNGSVVGLGPGESIETVNPSRPNTAFDGFVRSICVPIGAALEIPYEILLQHFTSSYTAARASFVEFWKAVRTRRAWLAASFCQPVYEEWLAEAVAKGRVSAPGFFEDLAIRAAWSAAEWNGPAQGQINEKVEAGAANDRVQFGFSTATRETAELTGGNWDQIQRARRRELAKQAQQQPTQQPGAEPPEQETP